VTRNDRLTIAAGPGLVVLRRRFGDMSGSARCGLRLNLEARSEELMEQKREEVLDVIRG
jgi:hypothetical protein